MASAHSSRDALGDAVELARRDSALLFDGAVAAGAFNFHWRICLHGRDHSAQAIQSHCWRSRRTRSSTPILSAKTTFGLASDPATENL